MTWRAIAGVDGFLRAAGDFLAAREAEHNLMLGLTSTIVSHPEVHPDPRFWVGEEAAALQTPPYGLVLSMMSEASAAALGDLLATDPLVNGVHGPCAAAAAFAARFAATVRVTVRERIFALDAVVAPRPATGAAREIEERDRPLLVEWLHAFHRDARLPQHNARTAEGTVGLWLRRATRTMYLWEDGGAPVCMAGAGGTTPNGIRIGPVYTPDARRGRGYASNLVAWVSARQLALGHRFCFLYTDLANPTSNAIYQAIGYRAVCDIDQLAFDR